MATTFAYSPLTSADAFRLLVLEPGSGSEEIQCRIYNTTHSSDPIYDALSYTWGCEKDQRTCRVNGAPVNIRRNLYHALRDLRSPYDSRILWIDALCINQASIQERNHQVAQMSAIYSRAAMVRIYLGRASPTSSLAMNWIEQFASRRCSPGGIITHGSLSQSTPLSTLERQVDCWQALRLLCARKYWRRLWIVQEVVLAERLLIHCGRDEAPWEGVDNLLDGFRKLFKPKAARPAAAHIRRGMLMKLRDLKKMHRTVGCPLDVLLEATRDSLCSDPRDKVYGLLGLANNVRAGRIEINYATKTGDAYGDMLKTLWKFFLNDNGAALAVKGCQTLSTMFVADSEDSWAAKWEPATSSYHRYNILGRSCGKIIYVGTPWEGGQEMEGWTEALVDLARQGVSDVEARYRLFCNMVHTTSAASDFHKVGVLKGDSHSESDSEGDISPRQPDGVLSVPSTGPRDKLKGCEGDSDREASAEHLRRLTSCQEEEFDLQSLRRNGLRFFVGSRGQMGLVSEGIRPGDGLCQFEGSDLTAIVQRRSFSRTGIQLVGKAIMAPEPTKGLRGGSSKGDNDNRPVPQLGASGPAGGVDILETEKDDETVHLLVSASNLAWLTSWYPAVKN